MSCRSDPAFDSEWESDVEDSAAAWESPRGKHGTGVQLRELYQQKRLAELEVEMKKVELEYYKQHADTIDVWLQLIGV